MDENCTHDCGSCGQSCSSRQTPESLKENPHQLSRIKKVIGVISGKGGVGKSMVTGLLAAAMSRAGLRTAVLDADITGPSIPRMFGLTQKAEGSELGLHPVQSAGGVAVMSINLLLPEDTDPVVWRGPVIAGAVKQFWTDVVWGDVDFMFVDMPPGTGDVALTVFQSLPVDGLIIVTSPQEMVSMIVSKAVKMARLMNVPILGLVENMGYLDCPDCGKRIRLFGESRLETLADEYDILLRAALPLDPALAAACDAGRIEEARAGELEPLVQSLRETL